MPTTVGNYEFRLYLLNTYSVLARSPAVTVLNINPTPNITAFNPASVAAGSGAFAHRRRHGLRGGNHRDGGRGWPGVHADCYGE
jgi:hypothetical protein